MNGLTNKNHQIIGKEGQPQYVVIPFEEYQSLISIDASAQKDQTTIPHEVVRFHVMDGLPLIKAWRKYKKVSQEKIAKKLGISQSAYSQIENAETNQKATREKVAEALGITYEQTEIED